MAIGVYKYVRKTDLKIGEDIRIIGFDNTELGAFIQPRLSTISYSKHRWGMIASEKIVKSIQGEQVEDEHIYTTFIDGRSFPNN